MEKSFSFTVNDEVINIEFNQACGFKLAQYLGVKDPTVQNLATAMKDTLSKDGMLGLKFLISAGIYGHEFVHSDSMVSKFTPSKVGQLLMDMDDNEATKLVQSFYENLGLNLKVEADKPNKKKAARKKVKKN